AALNPFHLVEGRAPKGPSEIVLDRRTAEHTGYHVGDTATFQTQDGVHQATLVGIARFGRADSPAGTAVTLFDDDSAQLFLAAPGQVDTIVIQADRGVPPATVAERVRQQLTDSPTASDVEVVTGAQQVRETQDAARETFAGIRTFLLVFALI